MSSKQNSILAAAEAKLKILELALAITRQKKKRKPRYTPAAKAEKVCVVCGKTFIGAKHQVNCSKKCARVRAEQTALEYHQRKLNGLISS